MVKFGLLVPLTQAGDASHDEQWLVPCVLREVSPEPVPSWPEQHEFLLWFSTRPDAASANLSRAQMASSQGGFLPRGVTHTLMGALVQMAENTADRGNGMRSEVTKRWARLALGSTQFLVVVEPELNSLRIVVEGRYPYKVVEAVEREVPTRTRTHEYALQAHTH